MSQLNIDTIKNSNGNHGPNLVGHSTVTGDLTVTGTITGDGSGLTGLGVTANIKADTILVSGVTTATTFDGNLSGNVTGNVTGDLTGNSTGIHTGNVTGDVTGNVSGNITGVAATFSGDVSIADKIIHTGDTDTAIRFPAVDTVTVETSGSEALRITSGGQVRVGSSGTPSNKNTVTPLAYVDGNGVDGALQVNRHTSVGGGGSQLLLSATRGSSITGHTVLQSGDGIGTLEFAGSDGDEFVSAARVQAQVDGTPGDNDMPGRLIFSTTADAASSPTERMRISSDGVITAKNGTVAEIDTLTDASTVTPDFAASTNFTLTFTSAVGNSRTIANPSNLTAGQSGSIFLVQDSTGSRTVSWGSYWDWAAGTAPTLTTTGSAVDRIDYIVRTSTSIHAVATLAYS